MGKYTRVSVSATQDIHVRFLLKEGTNITLTKEQAEDLDGYVVDIVRKNLQGKYDLEDELVVEEGFDYSEPLTDEYEYEIVLKAPIRLHGKAWYSPGFRNYPNGDPGDPEEFEFYPDSGWISDVDQSAVVEAMSKLSIIGKFIIKSEVIVSVDDVDEGDDYESEEPDEPDYSIYMEGISMKFKVGDKIKIIYMDGEPHYTGKEGTVTRIGKDPWGDTFLSGTWGGLTVYPDKDEIEIINESTRRKRIKESYHDSEAFVEWHNNYDNYKAFPEKYEEIYDILSEVDPSGDMDVGNSYNRLSSESQEKIWGIIGDSDALSDEDMLYEVIDILEDAGLRVSDMSGYTTRNYGFVIRENGKEYQFEMNGTWH